MTPADLPGWCTLAAAAVLLLVVGAATGATLPVGSAPKPLEFRHFPSRLHTFVWRNWTLVAPERLARVIGTSPENIQAIAESMGLPPAPAIPPEMKARGYITIIRRNWHILPYDQLLVLLDMTADELAFALREDDFLFHKLGRLKPACEPLAYRPPNAAEKGRAAEIKAIVDASFGEQLRAGGEPRFAFVEALSKPHPPRPTSTPAGKPLFELRFIYSYFALFGDPLMNPELDPYPEGLLQRLSELGVNGVWMHVVLRNLAPSTLFPEFGQGHEKRLATLRALVARAKKYGIDIYLYINEPRAMPAAFFEKHEDVRGVQEGDHYALCTSSPEVRSWLRDSLTHVFKNVPGLGGVFTITASENLTNCASHHRSKDCPHCAPRNPAEIIAEVNLTVAQGVHRAAPDAKVLSWDWGWPDAIAPEIIERLPSKAWLMSVSEWSRVAIRGRVRIAVGEYSISVVGPGPRATEHWAVARDVGLKTVAKCQFNNTWELSAVPYLPVLDLIAEHCSNLAKTGVNGLMLSWSLGGYPSPNLEVAAHFNQSPPPSADAVLDAVARNRYGPAAPLAREAWSLFSRGFRSYPFHISVLYLGPQQVGPANLLYREPTGYRATMVGFPYDDVGRWSGPYGPNRLVRQFRRIGKSWRTGMTALRKAVAAVPPELRDDAEAELRFAEAAGLHFRSVANQASYIAARNALLAAASALDVTEQRSLGSVMRASATDEIKVATQLFALTMADSRIGYEASNHYYYVPLDLIEKVINCRHLLDLPLPQPKAKKQGKGMRKP